METHLLRLLSRLDRSRFSPVVCCLYGTDEYQVKVAPLVDRIVNLGVRRFDTPRGLFAYVRALSRLLVEYKPHVVQTYGYSCDFSAPFLTRLLCPDAKVITTRRGEDRNPRHQWLRRLADRWVQAVVCVSESVAKFAAKTEKTDPRKLRVIRNAAPFTESDRFADRKAEVLKFGTLGTVKPVKGTDLLVDAFLRFETDVAAELWIAGRTNRASAWADAVIRKAERSHLAGKIKFLGEREDPLGFLRSLDVFVLPSRSEGMSNALLEAMAVGLPCIATDVGSNRELLLGTAHAGIVCEPEADKIYAAMLEMSRAADTRTRLGHAAWMVAKENYSLRHMVSAYEKLYLSLCPAVCSTIDDCISA